MVNIIDNPKNSTFHISAKLVRGDFIITVSTDGASPILAKKIRDELAEIYDETYAEYIDFLIKVQKHILALLIRDIQREKYLKESTSERYRFSGKARQIFL